MVVLYGGGESEVVVLYGGGPSGVVVLYGGGESGVVVLDELVFEELELVVLVLDVVVGPVGFQIVLGVVVVPE